MNVRYRIATVIARGAQSVLYSARDSLTQRECLLKTGPSVQREAILLSKFNHPYAPPPFDLGEDDEIGFYAAYALEKNKDVRSWLKTEPQSLQRIALQMAEVLAFLHHRGWLYNDFKPEHFLISDQEIRVIDFGLCSPIGDSARTYSGTFPCISPERLAGRSADGRSDIFSLGMMLLQLLLPEEDWDAAPGLSELQQLQSRVVQLTGFWRPIVSQMTALEPSQRIASAHELWNLLLPRSARKCFLFFPLFDAAAAKVEIQPEEPVQILESSSRLAQKQWERTLRLAAWRRGSRILSYDLKEQTTGQVFQSLHSMVTRRSSSDFLAAVDGLRQSTSVDTVILLRIPENISAGQVSYLFYAISALKSASWLHFSLLTSVSLRKFVEETWKSSVAGEWTKADEEDVIRRCFPDGVFPQAGIRPVHPDCEALLLDLQQHLPGSAASCWPVAAREAVPPYPLEQLSVQERRILSILSVAGGSLDLQHLSAFFPSDQTTLQNLLQRLVLRGHIRRDADHIVALLPPSKYLKRFRKSQLKKIAATLLPLVREEPEVRHRSAVFAGKRRLAASVSLKMARACASSDKEASMHWYWLSFREGVQLPRRLLFGMIRHWTLRGKHHRTEKLLKHWRDRFGPGYRWADLALHSYQRSNQTARGIRLAQKIIIVAGKQKEKRALHYFSADLQGSC